MSNFRPINRDTGFLLPPSVDEWLPERHLARYVVEVIDQLDLSGMVKAYRGSGSASYHPAMLLGLLIYGYATKVFSSRAIERASYDSVGFRFIAGNEHPDHDTIATFRRRLLPQIESLFVAVLQLARTMGMLKLGTVALDGTKVHANASRHSALSWGHAQQLEKRLTRKEQINLTEEDSRMMPVAGGGFEQCYNAQAAVAADSLLIVAHDVTQAANDKQQLVPMVEQLRALPKAPGRTQRLLADSGYLSEANVEYCAAAKIEPLIALGREPHHGGWRQRFAPPPKAPPAAATALQKMAHRLKTPRGKQLYALRKQIPEPVFGSIKSAMGFRQFLLRGLDNAKGEWNLVAMSWNIRRMFVLSPA
jgi:transposase